MKRRTVVTRMREAGTHNFFTEKFGKEAYEAFGMKPRIETVTANTNDPKGLFNADVGPNTPLKGVSSHVLAEAIAAHLGLHGAWEQMMGRGSRERSALNAIDEWLKAQGE